MTPQLTDILFECWTKLEAAGGKDTVLQNMTVSHYTPDDINAYTVVLRAADALTHNLIFYTDYVRPRLNN